jgi:hypothetical protein
MLRDMAAYTQAEWSLLDQIALLTLGGSGNFEAMRHLYETHETLRVPGHITRFDPLDPPLEVQLAR